MVDKVRKLVAGEHSDVWFWTEAVRVRDGQPHELPPDIVRVARAVAWERSVTEQLERVNALDRELADNDKKDASWKISAEGQAFFIDRVQKRNEAADDGGYAFRKLLGKFVERFDSAAMRGKAPSEQVPPPLVVAHETSDDIVRECEASGADAACRSMIRELKKVVAGHPDDWFGAHAVWLRTRRPSSPSDVVRAARAVAWEPAVNEHMNRVEALTRDLDNYDANKDDGWKASAAGQSYLADRTTRRALALQEAGREFKRQLAEFVKRLEQIVA